MKQSGKALQFRVTAVGTGGAGNDGGTMDGNVKVDVQNYKKEEFYNWHLTKRRTSLNFIRYVGMEIMATLVADSCPWC